MKKMETEILKYNKKVEEKAAKLLKEGNLVALPTETVYGLGANGLDKEACLKIFEAKNRSADNPLILHISSYEMLEKIVEKIDEKQRKLLETFWPGPLTVVMKKKEIVPEIVTGGLDTVGVRMPANEIIKSIIEKAGIPVAAPSANTSGKPSPTTAEDVYVDLAGKIPLIVDGGECEVGIESTVLDISEENYTILRPGKYTRQDFEKNGYIVGIDAGILESGKTPKSPGQKYKHYAPKAETIAVYSIDRENSKKEILKIIEEKIKEKKAIKENKESKENKIIKIGIFKFQETNIENKYLNKHAEYIIKSLGSIDTLEQMAQRLFKGLRQFDKENADIILVEACEETGIGFSIMDRLKKSTNGNIIYIN